MANAVEMEREDLTREHTCPVCHVPRKKPCKELEKTLAGNKTWMVFSHYGRYRKAVRYGKVPALPGVDRG